MKKQTFKQSLIATLVLLLGVVALVGCGSNNQETEDTGAGLVEEKEISQETEETEEAGEGYVTEASETEKEGSTASSDFTGFDQYLTVDLGLSIDEVTAILGEPMSTTTIDLAGVESTTNIWMDMSMDGGTSTTVTFSDGYVTSISETSADSSDVLMNDYNEISAGMTEAEVYNVLGEPYLVMVLEILDTTSTTVSWINSDFSSITITFTEGVVSSSLQSNLD